MTYLAFRNLVQQAFRLVLSIGGVALAITLILLLNGFLSGIYSQVTAYLDHTPADLIVAQDGVTNLLSSTPLILGSIEDQARDCRDEFLQAPEQYLVELAIPAE